MTATSVVTALAYTGTARVSRTRRSTTGCPSWARWACRSWPLVFNVGLIIGGLCFAVFMAILGWSDAAHALAWLYALIGVVAGIAGMFVGIFPMNRPRSAWHRRAEFLHPWLDLRRPGVARLLPPARAAFPALAARPSASSPWRAFIALPDRPTCRYLFGEGLGAPTDRPDVWIVPDPRVARPRSASSVGHSGRRRSTWWRARA